MLNNSIKKGRGAQQNISNRFFELSHEIRADFLEYCEKEGELADNDKTQYLGKVFPQYFLLKCVTGKILF